MSEVEQSILNYLKENQDLLERVLNAIEESKVEINTPDEMTIKNPQEEVKVLNLSEITETIENALREQYEGLREEIKNSKTTEVSVKNQKAFPKEMKIKELGEALRILKEIAAKEVTVTVEKQTGKLDINFPRKASDAIPVVLTDATRGGFYNALTSVVFPGRVKEPFEDYMIYATIKDDEGYDYIGRENKRGKWVIQQRDRSTGVFKYAQGLENIETAWTGRALLEYNRLSKI